MISSNMMHLRESNHSHLPRLFNPCVPRFFVARYFLQCVTAFFCLLLVYFVLAKWEISRSGGKKVTWHGVQTFLVMLALILVLQIPTVKRLDTPLQQNYDSLFCPLIPSVYWIFGLSVKWGPDSVAERNKGLFSHLKMSLKDKRIKGVERKKREIEQERKLAVFCE